jgi:hypothetical protein
MGLHGLLQGYLYLFYSLGNVTSLAATSGLVVVFSAGVVYIWNCSFAALGD